MRGVFFGETTVWNEDSLALQEAYGVEFFLINTKDPKEAIAFLRQVNRTKQHYSVVATSIKRTDEMNELVAYCEQNNIGLHTGINFVDESKEERSETYTSSDVKG